MSERVTKLVKTFEDLFNNDEHNYDIKQRRDDMYSAIKQLKELSKDERKEFYNMVNISEVDVNYVNITPVSVFICVAHIPGISFLLNENTKYNNDIKLKLARLIFKMISEHFDLVIRNQRFYDVVLNKIDELSYQVQENFLELKTTYKHYKDCITQLEQIN